MTDVGTDPGTVRVTVAGADGTTEFDAAAGRTLRDVLLDHGISPHGRLARRANCGGRGLCATCGVRLVEGGHAPRQWHDVLAARFGYPRLSCQVRLEGDVTVRLVEEKLLWGGRE